MTLHASVAAAPVGAEPGNGRGLATVRQLYQQLREAGIAHCHWKGGNHLDAAMRGDSDLDVLIDRSRHVDLQRALAESGFRRFAATALTACPAVEDYLALDEPSGRLVHLHLHHRLAFGQKRLKGYRLPWEAEILATCRFDPKRGVHVAAPEMELLLLIVRAALQQHWRQDVAARLGRGKKTGLSARFALLAERADAESLARLAAQLLAPEVQAPVRRVLEGGGRPEDFRAFARVALPALRRHRTYGTLSATLLSPMREMVWAVGGLSRRRFHWAVPLRRVSPRGGAIVAFIGPDGSGKSTLCADTVRWLSGKLDVVPIYLGSGDGPASLWRKPLQLGRRMADRLCPPSEPDGSRGGLQGRVWWLARVPWALSLSLEKRSKLRRMTRARNRGMIVVCDRYAQDQVPGFNDGPLLGHLAQSRWRFGRALSAWEAAPYRGAALDPPDLVIKLVVSEAVAQARRPDMRREEIVRRIEAVRSLRFPPGCALAEIDADQPLDDVTRTARRLVWEVL